MTNDTTIDDTLTEPADADGITPRAGGSVPPATREDLERTPTELLELLEELGPRADRFLEEARALAAVWSRLNGEYIGFKDTWCDDPERPGELDEDLLDRIGVDRVGQTLGVAGDYILSVVGATPAARHVEYLGIDAPEWFEMQSGLR